jgi:hypothetical protein
VPFCFCAVLVSAGSLALQLRSDILIFISSACLWFCPRVVCVAGAALGFSDGLQCSECAKLSSAVGDAQLTSECEACCSSAADEAESLYISGRLSVCS